MSKTDGHVTLPEKELSTWSHTYMYMYVALLLRGDAMLTNFHSYQGKV